jgi:hypothetical protein
MLQGTSAYIINATSWTGKPDEWTNYDYQKSRLVDLQAGEVVLLEAAHCNSPSGPSLLQVKVSKYDSVIVLLACYAGVMRSNQYLNTLSRFHAWLFNIWC